MGVRTGKCGCVCVCVCVNVAVFFTDPLQSCRSIQDILPSGNFQRAMLQRTVENIFQMLMESRPELARDRCILHTK